jgi:hypothetical protein
MARAVARMDLRSRMEKWSPSSDRRWKLADVWVDQRGSKFCDRLAVRSSMGAAVASVGR